MRVWHVVSLASIVVLALAGGGNARALSGPLVKEDSLEAGGWPMVSSRPSGITTRFIERGRFAIGIVLRSTSAEPLTIVDVQTPEPPAGLVRQVGTRLIHWDPPPCPKNVMGCPISVFVRSPYTTVRPTAVVVAPGKAVGAQLNYELATCGSALPTDGVPAAVLDVTYHYRDGALRHARLPLGSARIRVRAPQPADCQRRPRSRIAVEGPFATSSEWTIPGAATGTCMRTTTGRLVCSDGDRCVRTAGGGLIFRSGLFQSSEGRPALRVEIRLPQLRGPGLYRTLPIPARALGGAQVRLIVGIGLHGWTTFPADSSLVTVTQASGTQLGGRFHASLTTRHEASRAHGVWRCTTLRS